MASGDEGEVEVDDKKEMNGCLKGRKGGGRSSQKATKAKAKPCCLSAPRPQSRGITQQLTYVREFDCVRANNIGCAGAHVKAVLDGSVSDPSITQELHPSVSAEGLSGSVN